MTMLKRFTHAQKIRFAILVNIIFPLGGMSTDIYLPSLPAITAHFHSIKSLVQFTVTSYVLALGLAQLIAGPISDAYGRKKLILIALLIQLISVIAILKTIDIEWMIFFRFTQGLGAGLMMVPARAVLNDIFKDKELKIYFNYATISFAIGPIIAPFIGGYLQHYFGWKANFHFILCYIGIVALSLLVVYRETLATKRKFSIHHLWQNYAIILSNKFFVLGSLFVGMIWSFSALFSVAGPFLVQTVMHKSPITYGRIALLMGIGWFIGNISNRFLFHCSEQSKIKPVLWLTLITSISMIIFSYLGFFNVPSLVIPTFIIVMLSGLIFPIYVSECLVIFDSLAASANACLFSIVWIIFGAATFTAALLKVQSLLPLALAYLGANVICFIIYYGLLLRLKRTT
jgi:DHA1 family bicyclomycin/chloramphenicol resistance-like MFS transporter